MGRKPTYSDYYTPPSEPFGFYSVTGFRNFSSRKRKIALQGKAASRVPKTNQNIKRNVTKECYENGR
jgi:hypothetical protein